jgi:hypothetical protein
LEHFNENDLIQSHLASGEEIGSDRFPELSTLSAAFFFDFVPVAKQPERPELVFIPTSDETRLERLGTMASWNFLWEAGQFRKEAFQNFRMAQESPSLSKWIESLPDSNAYLIPETPSKYDAYAPLFHLLPKTLLDRFGLPALKRPLWPTNDVSWNRRLMPQDFEPRLSQAFAALVWRRLDSGSGLRAFSDSDPLKLLSHSLDFWLPYALIVLEDLMRDFERCDPENERQTSLLAQARQEDFVEVVIDRPRKGGTLWIGEEDANDVTDLIVEAADQHGKLHALVDAVRSHRVADDFSPLWSHAREDFERKLYSKRSKVKVSFVEFSDTLPVHSARSEYTDDLLWQDFMSFLDPKERHIVVALRSGTTKLGDIASTLGYANHSPVSKALEKIRKKAAALLNLN